ncbi:MAG: ABC transporter permease [Peptococcaceae bacterium BICA1-8]|nr:MAG: ABC transporter permease [Peptococcaceae bacterium BICA1-8]
MEKQRIVDYLIAFLIILSLNFFLPRLLPGDPLTAIYGDDALLSITQEAKEDLAAKMGLDKPLLEQFGIYLNSIFKGDLGYSYYFQSSVQKLLLGTLPWTLLLIVPALFISTILGFIVGLESGWRYGRLFDKRLLTGFMLLNGFPNFLVGISLLLVFSVSLGIFPLAGAVTPYAQLSGIRLLLDILHHLVLPLTALVTAEIAASYLLTRTTVLTVLGEPFILTARAKGIRTVNIKYKHLGRNSLLPVVTRIAVRLGRMFTAVLLIENIFAYPGVGLLIYRAILARDFLVIQGVLFVVAVVILVTNFLLELLYKKIDPRVIEHAY